MTDLHYLDPNPSGSPAVVLLHGLGATCASWGMQMTALAAAGFRPLAPDAPGFGDSPYDGRGWSVARAANKLADLVTELGCGPVHLVGLSMGGLIAQQFAHDYPELTGRLVLASTFTVLRPDSLGEWYYFLRRVLAVTVFGLRAQARVVANRIFPGADQVMLREILVATIVQSDVRAYRGAMRSLGMFDSRRWLADLRMPVLVITGTQDSTVSPQVQQVLLDGIPGARQMLIQGAGHAASIDRPEEFNRALLDFLNP